jgi:hypothetical protein
MFAVNVFTLAPDGSGATLVTVLPPMPDDLTGGAVSEMRAKLFESAKSSGLPQVRKQVDLLHPRPPASPPRAEDVDGMC